MMTSGQERQVASNLEGIREDHRERYRWAAEQVGEAALVLDAGCGVGYGSSMLGERVQRVMGIDISQESIEYANRYWKNDKITFEVQDLHRLSFDNDPVFDVVVAFESIEHLASPELFFLRLRPYVTRETRIFLSSPNQAVNAFRIERNPYHFRHYTEPDMRAMLERVGFVVVAVQSQDDAEVRDDLNGRFLLFECAMGDAEPETDLRGLESQMRARQHEHMLSMADEMTGFAKAKSDRERLLEMVAAHDEQLRKSGEQLRDLRAKYQVAELEAKYARQFKESEQRFEALLKESQQRTEALLKEVWDHPAIRRLVRFNRLGLKLLGLFGLGHVTGASGKE